MWLTPDSTWQERYRGWPVLKKLNYVDALMQELAEVEPTVVTDDEIDRLVVTMRAAVDTVTA